MEIDVISFSRKWKCENDHPSRSTVVNPAEMMLSVYMQVRLNQNANCFFSVESKDYEFRFVWIQKDVGEERDAICTHWNADCLLENLAPVTTNNDPRRKST